jgi:ferredoxin
MDIAVSHYEMASWEGKLTVEQCRHDVDCGTCHLQITPGNMRISLSDECTRCEYHRYLASDHSALHIKVKHYYQYEGITLALWPSLNK